MFVILEHHRLVCPNSDRGQVYPQSAHSSQRYDVTFCARRVIAQYFVLREGIAQHIVLLRGIAQYIEIFYNHVPIYIS